MDDDTNWKQVGDAAMRRTGLGGSDASAALGVSPWQTPFDLWLQKTNRIGPVTQTERMRWGVLLEPLIICEYAERTGRTVKSVGTLRHTKYPWMLGHVDGVAGEDRVLEVKTAGTSLGWGEPGSDEIPLHYLVQCHHYLAITGFELCDVAVLIAGSDFRIYTVRADIGIANSLIDTEHAFWQRVLDDSPPDPINIQDARKRWGRETARANVTADEATFSAIRELRTVREVYRDLNHREDEAKLVVVKALADKGDTLVDLDGNILATWRMDNGRKAYTVEAREPSRHLLIKD
jgi:putative phage-type endonuclease